MIRTRYPHRTQLRTISMILTVVFDNKFDQIDEADCMFIFRVPVKCETKSKRNEINRNEIHRNETKFTETKRNGIIQNEIKPILTKPFLGERQDKN